MEKPIPTPEEALALLAEIARTHTGFFRSVALKLTKFNYADADDLLQESLQRAVRKIHTYRGDSMASWVKVIITHLHFARLRNKKILYLLGSWDQSDADEYAYRGSSVEDAFAFKERASYLKGHIKELSTIDQTVLEEFYFSGMKESEIAVKHRMPLGSVKSQLNRIRWKLKRQLKYSRTVC